MRHPLESFITVTEGHFAVARGCRCCKWVDVRAKGGRGRGTGFREGNKQRGRAIEHAKHCEGIHAKLTGDQPCAVLP